MKRLISIALTILFAFACKDSATSPDVRPGTFALSMLDTVGNPITSGFITLHQSDSKIDGTWRLNDGRSGTLIGSITDNQIDLNLNPEYIDNNLILQGNLSGKTFSGQWFQIGFPGVMARGLFVALKQ